MSRFKNTILGIVPCSLAIALVGCGSDSVSTGKVTGTITVNGQPRKDVYLRFAPVGKKVRPAVGVTDAGGRFEAQFLANQSGVPLGKCVAKLSITDDDGKEYLPPEFNEQAEDNPDLNLEVDNTGLTFDYDITFNGELPPVGGTNSD